MKSYIRTVFALIALLLSSYTAVARKDQKMDRFIDDLMSRMTLEEKIGQTNLVTWDKSLVTGATQSTGATEKIARGAVGGVFNVSSLEERRAIQEYAVKTSRLGIPLIFGLDVIHGFRTTMPIPLALSCTWDMDLIERTAASAADEASSEGLDWVFSPMVDLVRDPRWGRVAESAGEDPYLGGCVAAAMVRGHQGKGLDRYNSVMSCVKHFGLYGASEGGRDYDMVDMSLDRMYNFYLPPYKAAVDAGAGSMMSSFNDINAVPATGNKWLLTDLLRGEWGFDGFVVSDYTSLGELRDHGLGDLAKVAGLAHSAGLDMDMVSEALCTTYKEALAEGYITKAEIDQACRRILEAKYKLGLFKDPYVRLKREVVKPGTYDALALEAARSSMVLLKNENKVLPLKKGAKVALVGPLAKTKWDLKGTWSGFGRTDDVVSVMEGISRYTDNVSYAPGTRITENPNICRFIGYNPEKAGKQEDLIAEALKVSADADVIVAVLGETNGMSGESASLTDISLQATQRQLLEALVVTGKDVVLVLVNGRPLSIPWENEHCGAILEAWAPGSQGGNAVADILFGEYNPSGRLSMTFPLSVGQIPVYYNTKRSGRPHIPFKKYRLGYIDSPIEPLYPFGYGLSYSEIEYEGLAVGKMGKDGKLPVSVTIYNKGEYGAEETVQLYIGDPVASVTRPIKELKQFRKVTVGPGEKKEVRFEVTEEDLKFFNSEMEHVWEPGEFIVSVGPNSSELLSETVYID